MSNIAEVSPRTRPPAGQIVGPGTASRCFRIADDRGVPSSQSGEMDGRPRTDYMDIPTSCNSADAIVGGHSSTASHGNTRELKCADLATETGGQVIPESVNNRSPIRVSRK